MEEKKVYLVYGTVYFESGATKLVKGEEKTVLGVMDSEDAAKRRMNSLEIQFAGLYDEFSYEPWVVEGE